MVVKAFRALGHEVFVYGNYYKTEDVIETWLTEDEPFDLVLFMECNDDDPQYEEIKYFQARKTACWLFDTSYYPDHCEGMVRWFNFDHLFLANPISIRRYNSVGFNNVTYLPYACDPDLHERRVRDDTPRNLGLIGSIRSDRIDLRDALSEKGIELELVGDVFREEYIDALADTKIVINQNPEAGRGLLNMRWFEAPAAGALVFGEQSDLDANKDVLNGWALGHSSISSMANFAERLLRSPTELAITRREVQNYVLAWHTYRNRCKTILETMFPHEN
jgi:hypothetical protein